MRHRLAGLVVLWLALLPAAFAGGVPVVDLDGRAGSFADHIKAGRWTVVMMWTTYCGVCRRQYPMVSAFHDAHHAHDGEVLGVSLDGPEALADVRAHIAGKPFSFPSIVADPHVMARMFEQATGTPFTGTPTYLVFNPARQLVAFRSGEVGPDTLDNYLKKKP